MPSFYKGTATVEIDGGVATIASGVRMSEREPFALAPGAAIGAIASVGDLADVLEVVRQWQYGQISTDVAEVRGVRIVRD